MDFSKLKFEVYDLLGVILPGLLAIFGGWIAIVGWRPFVISLNHLSGTGFTVLTAMAFVVGQFAQECGELYVRSLKGARFAKLARDRFWATDEARVVGAAIAEAVGHEVTCVDSAFDHCLTCVGGAFSKRDAFVATADLCRSLTALLILGIIPVVRSDWLAGGMGCTFSSSFWKSHCCFLCRPYLGDAWSGIASFRKRRSFGRI